jgi:chromosome segregation ATPase
MPVSKLETLSPFGRLAVALDADFSQLERLSGQIQRLDIETDGGLDHALKLLNDFAERGQSIAQGIGEFAQAMQQAQARSEKAAQLVAERAEAIQARKEKQQKLNNQLAQVKQQVKIVNDGLASFRKPGAGELSDADKAEIKTGLDQVQDHFGRFIADIQSLKVEAGQARFKSLERDAQALLDTLESSRRKIVKALG